MANATELKFGDPGLRVAQSDYWTVLLRPRQPTLGSLVLVCRENAQAFSAVSAAAFADLQLIVQRVEGCLREVVAYERINYIQDLIFKSSLISITATTFGFLANLLDVSFPLFKT